MIASKQKEKKKRQAREGIGKIANEWEIGTDRGKVQVQLGKTNNNMEKGCWEGKSSKIQPHFPKEKRKHIWFNIYLTPRAEKEKNNTIASECYKKKQKEIYTRIFSLSVSFFFIIITIILLAQWLSVFFHWVYAKKYVLSICVESTVQFRIL